MPGESLSLLVIEKLPFAPPDDPLVQARCERIIETEGDWFADYTLPTAVLQLRQGFGRLIRSRADRGVVADPRARGFATVPYGRLFLEALPSCPVVSDRGEVADFFASERPGARLIPSRRGQEEEPYSSSPAARSRTPKGHVAPKRPAKAPQRPSALQAGAGQERLDGGGPGSG